MPDSSQPQPAGATVVAFPEAFEIAERLAESPLPGCDNRWFVNAMSSFFDGKTLAWSEIQQRYTNGVIPFLRQYGDLLAPLLSQLDQDANAPHTVAAYVAAMTGVERYEGVQPPPAARASAVHQERGGLSPVAPPTPSSDVPGRRQALGPSPRNTEGLRN